MGTYAYTHTYTNICKLTGFLLAFTFFFLINNNIINSINDLLLNYWTIYVCRIYWSGYLIKRLYLKHIGHEMQDNIATITGVTLDLKSNKAIK